MLQTADMKGACTSLTNDNASNKADDRNETENEQLNKAKMCRKTLLNITKVTEQNKKNMYLSKNHSEISSNIKHNIYYNFLSLKVC